MVHIFAGDRPSFDLKMLKILIQRGGRNQSEEKRPGMTLGRLANRLQTMLATKPGVFEYEIEAAAMHVIIKNGARQAAYPPIVASGLNSCTLHYSQNSRKTEENDVVLMLKMAGKSAARVAAVQIALHDIFDDRPSFPPRQIRFTRA
jgi:hypothetical protein